VPEVAEPVDTRALAARVEQVVAAGGAAVVLHESATTPLAAVDLPGSATDDGVAHPSSGEGGARVVLVVVGPEGGIADEELQALAAAGASVARLGPHVLRTSTAGPVALALLAQRLGRWG
jgi:16S rRNA (uracil1498-N3)-methyltransferase